MRPLPALAAAALLAGVLSAPAASAPAPKRAALDGSRGGAERALEHARDIEAGRGVRTGRELTLALKDLANRYRALGPEDRAAARQLLARPTDGGSDPPGDGYAVGEAAPYCTANFCIHYVTSTVDAPPPADGDSDGVPDYVESMATEFEFVHTRENGPGPGGFNWREPNGDGSRGEPGGSAVSDRTDVYLKQLAGRGIFGYATTDPGQPGASQYAYMVMDDDFATAEFGYPNPLDPLRVTAAHEYNHVLQFGYDVFLDAWMFESTAVWMEDEVYDGVDDYLNYLRPPNGWVTTTETPLTKKESPRMYGSAVWNQWLAGRYGPDAVRGAWEAGQTATPANFSPGAYGNSVIAHGGPGFAEEFSRFSAATAEWRAPGSGFAEGSGFPDVERLGSLFPGDFPSTVELDHTTFGLFDVPPSPVGAVRMTVTVPAGTSGAIALVARTGASPTAGTVTTRFRALPSGGSGSVELPSPGGYGRITAVLVNADTSQSGFGASDWNFTRDDQPFDVELEALASPSVAPANSSLPTISGTPADGATLTAGAGSWSGTTPLSYARQWRRCNAGGSGCADIAGATATTYNPGADDIGQTLRVRVTASNSAGQSSAESGPTGTVQASPPTNTAPPQLSGTASEGHPLSSTSGDWSGTAPITYARQWLRCDGAGLSCQNIVGATGVSYTPVSGDVGHRLRVAVTASNTRGSSSPASSDPTTTVAGTAPLDENPPQATGTAQDGQALTAADGTWSGTTPITFSRQWLRCDADGLNCTPIAGETGGSYTLGTADIDKRVRLRVTATNPAGSRSADSAARGPILPLPPVNSALPGVSPSGAIQDGDTLSALPAGTWSGHPPVALAYEWLRCDGPAEADACTAIAAATATAYTLTAADVGKYLRVRETGSNAGGSGPPVRSAPTAQVAARLPASTAPPAISGTPQDGNTLTTTDGTWSGTPPITFSRQWLRCNGPGAGEACSPIGGATGATYNVVTADVGLVLRSLVSATNARGVTSQRSAGVGPIAAAASSGGGSGGSGGGGSGGGPLIDTGAALVIPLEARFAIATSSKLKSVLSRGLAFDANCNTACRVNATLSLDSKTAKRLRIAAAKLVKIGSGSGSLAAAGKKQVIVKLTRKARARLAKVRSVKATLRVVVADAQGTAASPLVTRVSLKR